MPNVFAVLWRLRCCPSLQSLLLASHSNLRPLCPHIILSHNRCGQLLGPHSSPSSLPTPVHHVSHGRTPHLTVKASFPPLPLCHLHPPPHTEWVSQQVTEPCPSGVLMPPRALPSSPQCFKLTMISSKEA